MTGSGKATIVMVPTESLITRGGVENLYGNRHGRGSRDARVLSYLWLADDQLCRGMLDHAVRQGGDDG